MSKGTKACPRVELDLYCETNYGFMSFIIPGHLNRNSRVLK